MRKNPKEKPGHYYHHIKDAILYIDGNRLVQSKLTRTGNMTSGEPPIAYYDWELKELAKRKKNDQGNKTGT